MRRLLHALWLRLRLHDLLALLLAAALAAFLAVGLFDSLFDEPRTGLLFYLLCWMALLEGQGLPRPVPRAATGAASPGPAPDERPGSREARSGPAAVAGFRYS